MTSKIFLAALVLVVSPGLAVAQCAGHAKEDVVMSCAAGTTFDSATQTCVPETTS